MGIEVSEKIVNYNNSRAIICFCHHECFLIYLRLFYLHDFRLSDLVCADICLGRFSPDVSKCSINQEKC